MDLLLGRKQQAEMTVPRWSLPLSLMAVLAASCSGPGSAQSAMELVGGPSGGIEMPSYMLGSAFTVSGVAVCRRGQEPVTVTRVSAYPEGSLEVTDVETFTIPVKSSTSLTMGDPRPLRETILLAPGDRSVPTPCNDATTEPGPDEIFTYLAWEVRARQPANAERFVVSYRSGSFESETVLNISVKLGLR